MTERERDLLCAAENVLASWAVVRASSDVLGAASKERLSGLALSLARLTLSCDAYPDEALATARGETNQTLVAEGSADTRGFAYVAATSELARIDD